MDYELTEFCGWTGTLAVGQRKMPTILLKVGRRWESSLLDIALGCSLARKDVIKPHWILPGEMLSLELVHIERRLCPMASIPLEVQGKSRWKWLGLWIGCPIWWC